MNKKNILINILIVLTILLIAIIPNYCYSSNKNYSYSSNTDPGSSLGLGDLDEYEATSTGSTKLKLKANIIFSVIRDIGIVLSVVMLIVLGIKYMLGSVEEKANYKETLLPYIIGAFLVFTGSLIPQLIYDFMKNF